MMKLMQHSLYFLVFLTVTTFSLLTFWQLVVFLSFSSIGPLSPMDESVIRPCCGGFLQPLLWNLTLAFLFVLQHSFMATSIWKCLAQRVVGVAAVRLLYIFCSCSAIFFVIKYWWPLPGPPLWFFSANHHPLAWLAIRILHSVLWTIIGVCILAADPLELIGFKQFWNSWPVAMQTVAGQPLHCRLVPQRHAGLVAFVIVLWIELHMSVDRFLLALVWTGYVLLGSRVTTSDYEAIRQLSPVEIWGDEDNDTKLHS